MRLRLRFAPTFLAAMLMAAAPLPPAGWSAAAPAPGTPALAWPDLASARHARAWFAAYHEGEAAMKAMYAEHYSADALASRPIDVRLGGYRDMRRNEGALTPIAIPGATASAIQVVARTDDGRILTLEFECDASPPHGIRGIRVEAGGPEGPGPGPGAMGPPLDDAAAVAAMRDIVARAAAADSFSGAVLLARDGKPLLREAWNRAERERGRPNTPATRFNLGSINKVFTRVAIAQLAGQGKLSLDDPLTRWLPDWPGPSASKITIAMLAAHRAGIGDIFGPRYDAMDRSKLRHNRDYIPLFRDEPLWFEPGTSERYSNGSYVLLGEIIARASGLDYYDYMRERVWGPAGMKATGYVATDDTARDVAMGYTRGESGRDRISDNRATRPGLGSAAGGGYSTLDDMLRFDQALLAHRLCAPGWTAWVTGGPPPGATQAADARDERPGFGFAGGAPGISAHHAHEGALTLIVLGNFDPPLTQAVGRQLRSVLRRMKD